MADLALHLAVLHGEVETTWLVGGLAGVGTDDAGPLGLAAKMVSKNTSLNTTALGGFDLRAAGGRHFLRSWGYSNRWLLLRSRRCGSRWLLPR